MSSKPAQDMSHNSSVSQAGRPEVGEGTASEAVRPPGLGRDWLLAFRLPLSSVCLPGVRDTTPNAHLTPLFPRKCLPSTAGSVLRGVCPLLPVTLQIVLLFIL